MGVLPSFAASPIERIRAGRSASISPLSARPFSASMLNPMSTSPSFTVKPFKNPLSALRPRRALSFAFGLDAEKTFVGNQQGDVKAAIASAAKTVEAIYSYPYQAHAALEPMNATAIYTADNCEVWCGTQNGEAALAAAAEASGLPVGKCDVQKMLVGGGFGRRGRSEFVSHAVRIAKEMPRTPIKLIKSREEDTTNGVY